MYLMAWMATWQTMILLLFCYYLIITIPWGIIRDYFELERKKKSILFGKSTQVRPSSFFFPLQPLLIILFYGHYFLLYFPLSSLLHLSTPDCVSCACPDAGISHPKCLCNLWSPELPDYRLDVWTKNISIKLRSWLLWNWTPSDGVRIYTQCSDPLLPPPPSHTNHLFSNPPPPTTRTYIYIYTYMVTRTSYM